MRTVAVVVLAALWVVAGSHCLLEIASGSSFLRCDSSQSDSSGPASHCGEDGCQALETGHYLASGHLTVPAPALETLLYTMAPVAESSTPSEAGRTMALTIAPPGLSTQWQFFLRAALPPRAPSLVS